MVALVCTICVCVCVCVFVRVFVYVCNYVMLEKDTKYSPNLDMMFFIKGNQNLHTKLLLL